MVGRCGGGFERDGVHSLEKESKGQKGICNNSYSGFGPTWSVIPIMIPISMYNNITVINTSFLCPKFIF